MDVMPVKCSGCAYVEGTEANRDVLTTLTRELCVMGRVNFYCHANMVNDRLPNDAKRLCRGYAETVFAQDMAGQVPPPWKRSLALAGLREMEDAEARLLRGEPGEDPDAIVARMIRSVTESEVRPMDEKNEVEQPVSDQADGATQDPKDEPTTEEQAAAAEPSE